MSAEVVRVNEVKTRLDCSTGKAYEIMKKLNEELKAKGYKSRCVIARLLLCSFHKS